MACLLQPICNFLHGFFRCKLPVEVVDVEVKITSMQGTHIFRRDRTTQLIKCTTRSRRLCLHPTIIKKMKTFLEVENKMGPITTPSSPFRPPLPDTNPNMRKDNVTEKRKRATPKKKFKPATPKPAAECPALLEAPPKLTPSVPVRESTPWPGTGKMSGNLFEDRNWLIPQNYLPSKDKEENVMGITSPEPPIKENEPKINEQSSEKCGWGPDCPFCKSQKEGREEDKTQQELKASPLPKLQRPQARRPRTLNLNKTRAKQQWEEEMERLNEKYNIDCFSSSELDSESDEGEQYCYEHGYETLI